jgi:uncharacterized membrane protein YdjX (TVP38/TMEM64 family)/rhodanese-related sulfurtransferase
MKRRNVMRLGAFALLLVAIAFAVWYRAGFGVDVLEGWVQRFGVAGPIVFMAIYALGTVLFLPGSIITLAGGALFGPVWGTVYNLTGATAGAAVAFLAARYLASDWVHRRAGGRTRQLIEGVEKEGWRFVAFVRLVPLFPFNLLNYALGLTRISLAQYIVASFVFMLPGAIAYTYLGYAGREALGGGEGMMQKGLLALALLGTVAFLPRLVKRLRAAPAAVPERISSAELRARLAQEDDIAVLDVRPAADYAGPLGNVPGSLNIPLDELPARLTEIEFRRERPLAVICRTNRMSGKAVELLRGAGFRRALLVDDGMVGWQKEQAGTLNPPAPGSDCS